MDWGQGWVPTRLQEANGPEECRRVHTAGRMGTSGSRRSSEIVGGSYGLVREVEEETFGRVCQGPLSEAIHHLAKGGHVRIKRVLPVRRPECIARLAQSLVHSGRALLTRRLAQFIGRAAIKRRLAPDGVVTRTTQGGHRPGEGKLTVQMVVSRALNRRSGR